MHRQVVRQALVVASMIVVLVAVTARVVDRTGDAIAIAYWLLGATVVAGCLVAFLVGKRYTHLPPAQGRVLCIVPAFNEPPDLLEATVDSLLAQTVPLDIVVIDDGSREPVLPTTSDPRVIWLRQKNTGKRGAQVAVLRAIPRGTFAFILTVDSDSQPYPDALEHLLRAMSDPRVEAATGWLYVRNYNANLISMAADIDIGASCVSMRASRSMIGALETTSGALALYRSSLLYDHLDEYAIECGTGDDRWLALRALARGQVVGVAEARVETEMPETIRGTFRQRLRWARSWWWMLPYAFGHLRGIQLISPLYGLVQLMIGPVVLTFAALEVGAFATNIEPVDPSSILTVVGTYLVVRYGLSTLYLIGRPGITRREKLRLAMVGTPAAVVLNLFLLAPTRYFALARLRDNRWRTREVPPGAERA